MTPIPLMDPGGRVFTYACAVCYQIPGITRLGDEPPCAKLLQSRHHGAAICCTCRECGQSMPRSHEQPGMTFVCRSCGPAAMAERDARLDAYLAREAVREKANEEAIAACPDAVAARALCQLMSGVSEECYCASWLSGLEYSLWEMVAGGDREFGLGEVSLAQVDDLRALSGRCDGWWMWVDEGAVAGRVFVRLDAWGQVFARR
jgi:hypothetical protein